MVPLGHSLLLSTRYCCLQGIAVYKVLLSTGYCCLQGIAVYKVLLSTICEMHKRNNMQVNHWRQSAYDTAATTVARPVAISEVGSRPFRDMSHRIDQKKDKDRHSNVALFNDHLYKGVARSCFLQWRSHRTLNWCEIEVASAIDGLCSVSCVPLNICYI